jgi:hypothetical protein
LISCGLLSLSPGLLGYFEAPDTVLVTVFTFTGIGAAGSRVIHLVGLGSSFGLAYFFFVSFHVNNLLLNPYACGYSQV